MKKLLIFLFLVVLSAQCYGQIITTVAGGATGHGGYWGEGGPATAAELVIFGGLAVDKFDNIYIAQNSRIVKVDAATGIITTVAGTGVNGYNGDGIPATAAQINLAGLVFVDSSGNFYIGDSYNYRLRKVDVATGIITTFAGNGTLGFSGDGGPATAADCDFQACTFDVFGNMIIEASRDHRIRKIDPSGTITTIAGTGVTGNSGDGGPATAATMTPDGDGIGTDVYGNIYFSDSFSSVRKINVSTGIITTVAGTGNFISSPYSDGVPATACHMDPLAIVADDTGNLYIDDGNSRIEKIDTFGIIHSIAGTGTAGYSGDGGPATAAEIYYPENVVLDQCNNVYIADFNNARVRKVTYPPSVLTLTDTITASVVDTVCTGTGVTYTATATSSVTGTTYSYQWYANGSVVSTSGSAYTYTPGNGDSVRCVVTGNQQCSGTAIISSNTINMVVSPIITPTVTVSAPASAPVGSMVTATATVTGAGSSYSLHWYDNAVLFNTTATPTVTYTKATGTDHITATVVPSSEGCYDSSGSVTITVTASDAGINNIAMPQVYIYPNPANDVLHIDDVSAPTSYRIQNIIGSVMQQGNLKAGSNNISIQSLPAGMYIVEVNDEEGERTIKKIIKQ